jgi:hypothetical protein
MGYGNHRDPRSVWPGYLPVPSGWVQDAELITVQSAHSEHLETKLNAKGQNRVTRARPRAARAPTLSAGAGPRPSTLNPAWFVVAFVAELASFTCNFALQRLALRTRGWFAVVTAGLSGNAVTDSLPGGDAAGAAVQFSMLTGAGFGTDTAVGGLAAFSLLGVGALPLFALPAVLADAPASAGLVRTAVLGIAGLCCTR